MIITSLLIRIDIKSLIYQNVSLFLIKIEFELLFYVDVDQNCLKLVLQCFLKLIL